MNKKNNNKNFINPIVTYFNIDINKFILFKENKGNKLYLNIKYKYKSVFILFDNCKKRFTFVE